MAGSARQTIEAGRIAAQQYLRGEGRLYIRIFPHKSITSIPLETRMGKGKGEPEYWAAVVKPGTVLYEMGGVTRSKRRRFASLGWHTRCPSACGWLNDKPRKLLVARYWAFGRHPES